MFKHVKSFFKKKQTAPNGFAGYADLAIRLITDSNGQLEDGQIIALLEANGIPRTEAVELLLFLPMAFCRHLLPIINWPDHYFEYISKEKQIKHLYSDNQRYTIIQKALLHYLAGNFTNADYYKIAGRSASFHSINQILLANPERKISEVLVTPETVIY
ncbi:hypothetical protein FNT36_19155 [Hymenobacter setariae]|uniref:Uncharacterized protein n=1 Tax=Hymenobacter setariae TaxID=2594794 RepID=A0A558BP70_9BACT|nr:hypothetical protein [Hymenobacter setariae]TVT38319.1 hypothetical protein FNT36_19155 [Hymenobacter setariae]